MDFQGNNQQAGEPPRRPIAEFILKLPIIRNIHGLLTTGSPFPNGFGHGTALILVLLVITAIVLLLLPIFFSMGGLQGVTAGLQNLLGMAGETADSAMGGYSETVQQAMGISYASEIDRDADRSIGLSLEDVEATQSRYSRSHPITVWGVLSGNSPGGDKTMNVNMSCDYESSGSSGVTEEGFMSPTDQYIFDREMSRNFRCEFPSGTIDGDSLGAHGVTIYAGFNFETMAYLTASFMDEEAYMALRQSEPQRLSEIDTDPTAKNTYSPIEIGVGAQEFPILISQNSASESTIGFSLSNRWDGEVTSLNSFNVMMPKGIFLELCDGPIDFVEDESQKDENFVNYTMVDDGVEYLSSLMTNDDFSEAKSFQCFLSFDSEMIFEDWGRLDPITLNIFPHIDFDYAVDKRVNIDLRDERDTLDLDVDPLRMGLESQPLLTLEGRGTDIDSATVTLRHRKSDEISSEVVSSYSDMPFIRISADELRYTFDDVVKNIIEDVETGDTISFRIDATDKDGESYNTLRTARIQNIPPELYSEEGLFFDSRESEDDEISCKARAVDPDGDTIESAIFRIHNRDENIDHNIEGACQDEGDYWLCIGNAQADMFEDGDTIECSVTLYDGEDYNEIENRVEDTVGELKGSGGDFDDEEACESDGRDPMSRGVTKGIMDVDGEERFVERTDRCVEDGSAVRDYYCDEETNRIVYNDITCSCSNGVCLP